MVDGDRAGGWAHFLEGPFTPASLLEEVRATIGESVEG
jgi:hypothetical protein